MIFRFILLQDLNFSMIPNCIIKMQDEYIKEIFAEIKEQHKDYEKLVKKIGKNGTSKQLENEYRSLDTARQLVELKQDRLQNYLYNRIKTCKRHEIQ